MKPRRWFRFTLRTLFVLMTLVACAVWYAHAQSKWLIARRGFLDKHSVAYGTGAARAPGLLWALGERGIVQVVVANEDKQLAKDLFPEAHVTTSDNPQPPLAGVREGP